MIALFLFCCCIERSIPYSGDGFFFSDTTFTNLNSLASIELLTLAIHGQDGVGKWDYNYNYNYINALFRFFGCVGQ